MCWPKGPDGAGGVAVTGGAWKPAPIPPEGGAAELCLAKLARVSIMLGGRAGGPADGAPGRPAPEFDVFCGGLPGGVVEWSTVASGYVRMQSGRQEGGYLGSPKDARDTQTGESMENLPGWAALNFSLKDSISLTGNVCPFSQMSTSFLILSYTPRTRAKGEYTAVKEKKKKVKEYVRRDGSKHLGDEKREAERQQRRDDKRGDREATAFSPLSKTRLPSR